MKKIIALIMALCLAIMLTGCGSDKKETAKTYKDGTYTARSSDYKEDEDGNGAGYGVVELTISSGKITACTFTMYELDGTVKDETYGSELSKENRLKAQKAAQSAPKYAALLVEAGSLSGVDAITGATISYKEFAEAVELALGQAEAAE